jgi:Capsule polysaccharide biosynthesis protein
MIDKRRVKHVLGKLPFTAEMYWRFVQQGKPSAKNFSLRKLEKSLPDWCAQALAAQSSLPADAPGRRILVFATLRYWIEHAALLSAALAGLGHQVTLAYLPYANWRRPYQLFDIRRQNVYARHVLQHANPLVQTLSLLDVKPAAGRAFSVELFHALQQVSIRDTQYTLQIEAVDLSGESDSARLYRLRLERNLQAAAALLGWIRSLPADRRPEVLITPNGSILEMGAIYQAARATGIPVVTYEFGEQRGRIWFAQNSQVMLQETDDLWATRKDTPLTEDQWAQIRALYDSRQNGRLWENFARLWQGTPSQGGDQARQALGLDNRPVVLLAANVIGDSLTLGRQIFSRDMTDWLERSVQFFAKRSDIQLVVRIHPGERYLKGPSVAQVVRNALPEFPEHVHLVEALDPINTYDLLQIADLGLAYTTTVGMEMPMSGVPVIVGGKTHYRGKGFTYDPTNWDEFNRMVDQALAQPQEHRLSRLQMELAWKYAYHFFFDYPTPFPWHLLSFWDELESWPVARALSSEGQAAFGDTFRWLAGEPRQWNL